MSQPNKQSLSVFSFLWVAAWIASGWMISIAENAWASDDAVRVIKTAPIWVWVVVAAVAILIGTILSKLAERSSRDRFEQAPQMKKKGAASQRRSAVGASKLPELSEDLERLRLAPQEQSYLEGRVVEVISDRVDKQVAVVKEELEKQKKVGEELKTQVREIVAEKRETTEVLKNIAEGRVIVDDLGKVVDMDLAAEQLLGVTLKGQRGRLLKESLKPEHMVSLVEGEKGEDREKTRKVSIAVSEEKTKRDMRASNAMVLDQSGNTVGMVAGLNDVTKQKALDALQREFITMVTHEIRTPMSGIVSIAEMLQQTQLDAEQRDYVGTIRSSGDALVRIVGDILDYSKIESGKLELEQADFNLEEILQSVVKLLRIRANEKKIELAGAVAPGTPTALNGDPHRLRQVLINLAGNALKFTERGGVYIRMEKESVTTDHIVIRITVSDTGPGIPEESRMRLFHPFAQAEASTARTHGGSGLGLVVSKQLVEMMGGQIGVDSAPGKGATFWFTLRCGHGRGADKDDKNKINQHVPQRMVLTIEPVAEGMQILVAEDNTVNQKVVKHQLGKLGCKPTLVSNGKEVLDATEHQKYDLVLMDCQMPEMDGYAATEALRKREGSTRHTPIIAMTAHADDRERKRCQEVGMDEFISKPVKLAELAAMIKKYKK